jgi:anhydro-N-acetylmuramic acid kinase
MRVVGMISGTSFDAIEVAAAGLREDAGVLELSPLGSLSVEMEPELRSAIAAALPPAAAGAEALCRLDAELGRAFGAAAARGVESLCGGRADLVVSHGQTVFHWVEDGQARGTLQLGQPAWIAEATGLPVVSDLRSRDIALGGQGAPLVSLFDALLLGTDGPEVRAALNLGGIANLTVLAPGRAPLAYDTGSANALIDAAVAHVTGGAEALDRDGRRGARGRVDPALLAALLDDPYYALPPPKSTGKEHFHLAHLLLAVQRAGGTTQGDDLVATATALAAETVARECAAHGVTELIAAGGGTRNPTLMRMLRERAGTVRVTTSDALGVPVTAKEAYAFAVLGWLTWHGLPGTLPSCTGAAAPAVLGSLTPGRDGLALPPRPAAAPSRLRIGAGP